MCGDNMLRNRSSYVIDEVSGKAQKYTSYRSEVIEPVRYKNYKELFSCQIFNQEVKNNIPKLAQYANNMCLHNGSITQEVGKYREKYLIMFLQDFVGGSYDDVPIDDSEIASHEKEIDVKMFDRGVSIKTITSNKGRFGGVKVSWVDDKNKAQEYVNEFNPEYDLLLLRINWNKQGGLYYITENSMRDVMGLLGKDKFLQTGKGYSKGTKITKLAINEILKHSDTCEVSVDFPQEKKDPNIFYKHYYKITNE